MNAKAIFLFFLLLLFAGASPLRAQTTADSLFRRFEGLNLIVRLPSQEKKMTALQQTIADPSLSDGARRRLEEQLAQTRSETAQRNRAIVRTFQEYFNAMPVFFVYDTTHQPQTATFLNDQLQPVSASPGEQLIQLRFGRPQADAGNRPESMVLTDSRLRDLERPFPGPLVMGGLGYGLKKLLDPEAAFERVLQNRVIKLNRKLKAL